MIQNKLLLMIILILGVSGCTSDKQALIEGVTDNQKTIKEYKITSSREEEEIEEELFDENILIDGYWIGFPMSEGDYLVDNPQIFSDVSVYKINNGNGVETTPRTPKNSYGKHFYSDFEFQEIDNNVQVGIGQVFEEHWDYKYSKKVEITIKKIDENTLFVKQIENYNTITLSKIVLKRIDKIEYEKLSEGYKTEIEVIDMIHKRNDINNEYYDEIEKIFGNVYFWLSASPNSFGEFGKGNTLQFNAEQQQKFMGLKNGQVFPETVENFNEYDDVYYGLVPIQEYFEISEEDRKYGIVTLTSKGGIVDAVLNEESQAAIETKQSMINLFLKITDGKEEFVRLKIQDSNKDTYLIIRNGKIQRDKINSVYLE